MTDDATERIYDLAGNLLRELAPLHSDEAAIDETCARWLHLLGSRTFGPVCAAALRTAFAECMSDVPRLDVPPGSVEFTQPERTSA